MRKLQTSDVFELARLIKKVGIKEDLKNIALKAKDDNVDEFEVGIDMVFGIIDKFSEKDSEIEFYEFLSGPFEVTGNEIRIMDPIDLVEGIITIASIEKWRSFLKLAVR